jgi:hypothetical protein
MRTLVNRRSGRRLEHHRASHTDRNPIMGVMRALCGTLMLTLVAAVVLAQTPQPFPRPAGTQPPPQAPGSQPSSQTPRPAAPAGQTAPTSPAPPTAQPSQTAVDPNAPSPATLGFPVYPTAQFLKSYDAGRGQRYYIYGTSAPYGEVVAFYRAQLREKGDQVFEQPPTYMFQIGRYREETMAFPPGVTVKDWTWGGSQGYMNPKRDAQPGRFPTIVMIVPAPPVAAPPPPK